MYVPTNMDKYTERRRARQKGRERRRGRQREKNIEGGREGGVLEGERCVRM